MLASLHVFATLVLVCRGAPLVLPSSPLPLRDAHGVTRSLQGSLCTARLPCRCSAHPRPTPCSRWHCCGRDVTLWVCQETRRSFALYMAVRALQCLYNAAKARGWWHAWGSSWPHGDTLLFSVTSAQVMYAYVMR